ncbi:hypothetical protein AALP_AA5G065300 [Arabis alpina]|uniref:KHDC4/BBP-like KH-domain type I domain-containing protein n=1 Tax=Arabis alpina TaxID=50452 RepID=A0A087GVC6_ARAAL|nr:hypothetical protein AALP_AA5G065300 [Arabis alpina]
MSSTSGGKMSMFGAKSGFVIPKNKLSGSLIPIFQQRLDSDSKLSVKLGKRKTKWGPDFTQDVVVKKFKVLAYQKRLDQITQQLESGTHQNNIAEHLEFEKREAIGEILELNPRYKAPSNYKPLLKEARLPIHVKEDSDFSFLSHIFGSQGDTQKRLENETGAKVQIFGSKTGGEKVELSPSDENEFQASWQELYFQISSDTYEKVDAAIAVIELLISSVSGNTGAGRAPPSSRSDDISTTQGNINATPTEPGSEQPTNSFVQPPQSEFHQQSSSFPLASNQPFYPPLNPSAPTLSSRAQDQEMATKSMNPNPLFARQPLPVSHNASLPHDSQVPRPSDLFSLGLSSSSRAYSEVAPRGSVAKLDFSTAPPYSGSHIQPIEPGSTIRRSPLFTFQPVPNNVFRPMLLPDIVSSNVAQSVRPLAPNFSPHPVAHQPGTELSSIPFPSSINLKHQAEYASGGSLRPMSGRPAGPLPSYPPTNIAQRPFHGDFGFLPQQLNISQISPRPNSQSGHLPHLAFQTSSVTPASQHFGQTFARAEHFGRHMDQPLSHPPALFHGNVRSSNLQNFGPTLPQMMPRNFPGAQFRQRPVFHHDNLIPNDQPQIHHRFNAGAHQVYDPFSPSDA